MKAKVLAVLLFISITSVAIPDEPIIFRYYYTRERKLVMEKDLKKTDIIIQIIDIRCPDSTLPHPDSIRKAFDLK